MKKNKILTWLLLIVFICLVIKTYATPIGPTISYKSNSSKVDAANTSINYSGGYIHTINLESNQQNDRWKAFVGNITGRLVLADSDNYSIYDWSTTTSQTGRVFATRTSGAITWADINCSFANATFWEEQALNHTSNPNDNISKTFNGTGNDPFTVGTVSISTGCPTTNLYVNSSIPSDDAFEEVLLYDGDRTIPTNDSSTFENIVYTTLIEQDHQGYRNGSTFDYQMILPEVALSSWTSSTAYYFYIELD